MHVLKQLGLGAVVGFVAALAVMFLYQFIPTNMSHIMLYSLYGVFIVLLVAAFIFKKKLMQLINQEVTEDEEDEHEGEKYRKFADVSLCTQWSMTVAFIILGLTVTEDISWLSYIISIIFIITSLILSLSFGKLPQKMYPERNFPNPSDKDYAEKLFAISDDGERHVMLLGLYQAYQLFNILMLFGIVAAIMYGVASGQPQLFAIVTLGIIMIFVNGRYLLVIRKKA